MPQSQLLLFPDPRPLVERLGPEFFRALPETPGIYLMRDAEGAVLYVGKALNLRRRLRSYRVANPDRMARRHLRMLRAAQSIEFAECPDEEAALAAEGRLLRSLRPPCNRAGTWPVLPRFLAWRATATVLELAVIETTAADWRVIGPARGAVRMRNALARLLWRVVDPARSFSELPHGWIGSAPTNGRRVECGTRLDEVGAMLDILFAGRLDEFTQWALRAAGSLCLFDAAAMDADLQTLTYCFTHFRAARR